MSEVEAVKDVVSVVRNRRTDSMFVAAYVAVAALVYLVIYQTNVGEFAQGVVTLVLGVFLNELKNMYSYETGTTRGEVAKAETIKALAERTIDYSERRQIATQTVVQDIAKTVPEAAKAAATVVAGSNGGHIKTTEPSVDATGLPPNIVIEKVVADNVDAKTVNTETLNTGKPKGPVI